MTAASTSDARKRNAEKRATNDTEATLTQSPTDTPADATAPPNASLTTTGAETHIEKGQE